VYGCCVGVNSMGRIALGNRICTTIFIVSKQDRQYTCNITLRRLLATTVAMEEQYVLDILCVYVCPDVSFQHACAILSSVVCPAVQYFFHIIS